MAVLPQHIHEVLAAALLYTFIHLVISPWLSRKYAGAYYPTNRGKRASWDSHVVSLFQSVLINIIALWVLFTDKERESMDWQARIWGYTGASGLVQSLAAGYFVWDFCITICYLDVFGVGLLAHAVSALSVYSFGYVSLGPSSNRKRYILANRFLQRPFLNYYASVFILYELSTPFLNIHWFFDKLGMTGTKAQLYNGIVLLFTFFTARLVWGVGQSAMVWYDMYRAIFTDPNIDFTRAKEQFPGTDNVMAYAEEAGPLPIWLAAIYLTSNITLNTLNVYWFNKMIKAVRKRFEPPKGDKQEKKEKAALPAGAATANDIAEKLDDLRRRHNLPDIDIEIKDDLGDVQ